jgi:hypothetical protein
MAYQCYSHNQIYLIVFEPLSQIVIVLLRNANLSSKVELKYITPLYPGYLPYSIFASKDFQLID